MNEHDELWKTQWSDPNTLKPNYNTTQEEPMNEVTQENPAVSKLREAFDTARNAIIEGSELARIVGELRDQVKNLSGEVHALHGDLDYVRNRNKELDEQVVQVRGARDAAIAEAREWKEKATAFENERDYYKTSGEKLNRDFEDAQRTIKSIADERDNALMQAMRLEEELAKAIAKLSKVEALFKPEANPVPGPNPEQGTEQPRAPTGQFQPKAYDQGSQGSF